tara:strand:+ start:432 stop:1451 length:1020 start_codon:yes stop_codon:yes gene_type:complete
MIVWLASYPRSGNTFLRVLMKSVFNLETYSIHGDQFDLATEKSTREIVGHKPLTDDFCLQTARNSDQLYLIKTHNLPTRDMKDDEVIYLIRDGRESIFSYLKYMNSFGTANKVLSDIIYGNTPFGCWGEHVTAWAPQSRKKTLFIKFEDLIDNPEKYIEALSGLLCKEPSSQTIPSFEELNKINPSFFRSGKKSSWKDNYTKKDTLDFWLANHKQMLENGYGPIPEQILQEENINILEAGWGLISSYQSRFATLLKEKHKEIAEQVALVQYKQKKHDVMIQDKQKKHDVMIQEYEKLVLALEKTISINTFTHVREKIKAYKKLASMVAAFRNNVSGGEK